MMRVIRPLILLLIALTISACGSVLVDKPFGEKPNALDVDEWNGYWKLFTDAILLVKVIDREKGILEFEFIGDTKGDTIPEKVTIYLTESGKWKFLFINFVDGEEEDLWYKYENYAGRMILLWTPSFDRFKEAVANGILEGDIYTTTTGLDTNTISKIDSINALNGISITGYKHTTDIVIRNIGQQELDIIKSEDQGIFFDWKDPTPIMKIMDIDRLLDQLRNE